jgi:uncharacterized protein YndB with AHSA1/START domain
MNRPLIVRKEGTLNAEPNEIWEIIINPEYFDEWMYVPGKVADNSTLRLGSKIEWINDKNIVYLTGEVIEFIPNKKIVISLQDISWDKIVPKGSVTYEFHLKVTGNGTKVKFYLGDLSIDPESEVWYEAYNSSDEIASIEKIIKRKQK